MHLKIEVYYEFPGASNPDRQTFYSRPQNRADGGKHAGVMFTTWNTARAQQAFQNRVGNDINIPDSSPTPVPGIPLRH